jgi:hypothetical protein
MARNWRKVIFYSLVWLLLMPFSYIFWQARNYYRHLHRFSFHVSERNAPAAKAELDSMRVFYNRASNLGLRWLADRTVFRKAPLYETEYLYLIGDYDGALAISSYNEDPLGYRIRGSALFRLGQALYQKKKNTPQLQSILESACAEFENALKASDRQKDLSDEAWNFDICDPNTLSRAVSQKQSIPLVIFDFPADKLGQPVLPRRGPPGKLLPQNQSYPGQSSGGKRRP